MTAIFLLFLAWALIVADAIAAPFDNCIPPEEWNSNGRQWLCPIGDLRPSGALIGCATEESPDRYPDCGDHPDREGVDRPTSEPRTFDEPPEPPEPQTF